MYGDRLQGKKAASKSSRLVCFLFQDGVVIVDSPGVGDNKDIGEIVLQYMPQACAFIYVINTPNAGGVQEDRVSLSLLPETTEQPLINSRSQTRIIECTSPEANRSLPFLSLFLETVPFENLDTKCRLLCNLTRKKKDQNKYKSIITILFENKRFHW